MTVVNHKHEISRLLQTIRPEKYAATRNYHDGAVTRLSRYISRGVVSTRQVFDHIVTLNLPWNRAEKLIQELAWRDYWQQVWVFKGDLIHSDLRQLQKEVLNHGIPRAIVEGKTGIHAVDSAVQELYVTGYMHNHMRMYIASICANIAHTHWLQPARWMYAHLLDGDLASNQLSWQWVAGTFSSKRYYANQENINKYFDSKQKQTFLDVEYAAFDDMPIPDELKDIVQFDLSSHLPSTDNRNSLINGPTLIYNYYNLDTMWHTDRKVQRVLLLEPSMFRRYPVSLKCIEFTMQLAREIPEIKVFVGEFSALCEHVSAEHIIYKEHPLNRHYSGTEEPREWMSGTTGYYPSFFKFWKQSKRALQERYAKKNQKG